MSQINYGIDYGIDFGMTSPSLGMQSAFSVIFCRRKNDRQARSEALGGS